MQHAVSPPSSPDESTGRAGRATPSRVRPARRDEAGTPRAVQSERVLIGALLRGRAVVEILGTGLTPDQCWRRDHQLILAEAIALHDRGVVPDLRLIYGTIGPQLDNPADLFTLADDSLNLMPSGITEHARRIRESWAAREMTRVLTDARRRIGLEPGAALNGFAPDVAGQLEAIRRKASGPDECIVSRALAECVGMADAPARQPLLGDLLGERETAMLHGQPRARKSWVAEELAISLSAGVAPFGREELRPVALRPVLLVGNEDSEQVTARRLYMLLAGHGVSTPPTGLRLIVGQGASLDDPGWQGRIVDEVRRHGIALVVIDPVRSVSATVDQGPSELQPLARYLRQLVADTGTSVLLVHHDSKPQVGMTDTRRRAQRASGGGMFAIVDAPIHVEAVDSRRSLVAPDGYKHCADPPPLVVELDVDAHVARLVATGAAGKSAEAIALDAAIIEHLRESGGGSGRAVAQALRRRREDVQRALERLQEAGTVDSARGKRNAQLWCLR